MIGHLVAFLEEQVVIYKPSGCGAGAAHLVERLDEADMQVDEEL